MWAGRVSRRRGATLIRVIDSLTRAGAWVTWVLDCGCHADQGAWGDAGGGAGSAAARRGTRQLAPSPRERYLLLARTVLVRRENGTYLW